MAPRRIVCLGDSITQGLDGRAAPAVEGGRWTAVLADRLASVAPDRYAVWNRGVGGDTTALALDRWQSGVAPLLPGILLIEFGINDCYVLPWRRGPRVALPEFSRNLREMLALARAADAVPVLIANHQLAEAGHVQGDGSSLRANLAPYDRAVRGLDAPCIDIPALARARGADPGALLDADGVHLSLAGNRIYGEAVAEALLALRL